MKGVELTDEWLIKLGFHQSGFDKKWWFNNEIKVEYDDHAGYGVSISTRFITGVDYVHELQNLVWVITRTELTVTP